MQYLKALFCGLLLMGIATGAQAFQVQFNNLDGANDGFNDNTKVAPVGGNDGTTLGGQRRIALSYAASILASRLGSSVPVRIDASFANDGNELECDAQQATLGGARPAQYVVAGDTIYPVALANALARRRVLEDSEDQQNDDIIVQFNPTLDAGRDDCLRGTTWYYGLDGKPGKGQIDFLATAVHELLHGLGFLSTVAVVDNQASDAGQFPEASDGVRRPDVFSRFVQDLSMPGQPFWPDLTDQERAASLSNGPNVVWGDSVTTDAGARLLVNGLSQGRVRLYAPAQVSDGSSISHWDTSLSPNQIMEPFANPDASVLAGIGMSSCVMETMGWQLINNVRCPDVGSATIAGQATVDPGPADNNDNDGGGGGGGCTMATDAPFDPLWGLLLAVALAVLIRRRSAPRRADA